MYSRIMVPVDLTHAEKLEKALGTAEKLASTFGAEICLVGVTTGTPGEIARTPDEYAKKLDAFGKDVSAKWGHGVTTKSFVSHDPAADLDDVLIKAIGETNSDLVVMASHVPGLPDHIFASNAGAVAAHASTSVFVVR